LALFTQQRWDEMTQSAENYAFFTEKAAFFLGENRALA
jgi:hypothetical protein